MDPISLKIGIEEIDAFPWLPEWVCLIEEKTNGLVTLLNLEKANADPSVVPGFYKAMKSGRLYVLEVRTGDLGEEQTAWLFEPIIRVRAASSRTDQAPEAALRN
jgi:hypothetical protein